MATATNPSSFRPDAEIPSLPASHVAVRDDAARSIPLLRSGDRLTSDEFERRYKAMPGLKKAELIEGVVYVASPVSDAHARCHSEMHLWLALYRSGTPGTVCSIDGTVRLDLDNRPQPDIHLRIDEPHGGQSHVGPDGYVEGAPELVAEVAYSSVSNDLHDKQKTYRRNLALEYVIWRVEDNALDWFVLRGGTYERLELSEDNLYRSVVFPGLWLDPEALLRHDSARVVETVQRGLASAEHAGFVERLTRQTEAQQTAEKVEDRAS